MLLKEIKITDKYKCREMNKNIAYICTFKIHIYVDDQVSPQTADLPPWDYQTYIPICVLCIIASNASHVLSRNQTENLTHLQLSDLQEEINRIAEL